MVLKERNGNQTPGPRPPRKRPLETSDPKREDDIYHEVARTEREAKQRRTSSPPKQARAAPSYLTPPTSSAPTSSQPGQPSRSSQRPADPSGRVHASVSQRDSWVVVEDDSDDNEDDVDEILAPTQTRSADTEALRLYGELPTKIVGIQYYRGMASPGEQVLMRREPHNQYDGNAIRVDNVAGTQIGHIPRQIAAKLAPLLDGGDLHVEGQIAASARDFDCPLSVYMFGPNPLSGVGAQLMADMRAVKLSVTRARDFERAQKEREKERMAIKKRREKEDARELAEERRAAAMGGGGKGPQISGGGQYGYANSSQAGPDSKPIMSDIVEASQRFDPGRVGHSTDEYGAQEGTLKQMPVADKPKAIKTEMLPYQLQALKWLLDQESPELPAMGKTGAQKAVQLWKRDERRPNVFTNLATNFSQKEAPVLARGGILADDMGLGKTLELIALLVADNERAGRKTGSTLIVCPLSVMSNWSGQIAQHVHEDGALSVYVYHGAGRVHMKANDFARYDVVLTTYQTLVSDYMPRSGKGGGGKDAGKPERKIRASGLYSVDWRRIVLDEGHTVRNPQSKGAAAVTAVMARARWVLTGTPIVNSLKDLYSLLRFVGVKGGLEDLEMFNRVLVRPLKDGDQSAAFLLRAIMKAFTLRRRKEMAFIDLRLPKLEEYVHNISFTAKERERYDALEAQAKGLLQDFPTATAKGNTLQAYAHLLEVLLRMRQCCNHWQLCGERILNLLPQLEKHKTVALTPENRAALQGMLQVHIESQEECAVCMEDLHNPVITTCAHAFGLECISRVIETQHRCPMCRAELADDGCLVHPAHECGDEAADDDMDLRQSSSKLDALVQILDATKREEGGGGGDGGGDGGDETNSHSNNNNNNITKTVVFSQWTKFLDLVEARLKREGYTICRIDGTMPAALRDEALRALERDRACTVLLASLGVCAVGLNLTAANQVILSDTWWAPAIEDQAVDRVHRLGQRRETRVFRLVVEDSVEQRTLEVQSAKRALMNLAFAEKDGKRERARAGRMADIRKLLGGGEGGKG